MGKAGKCIACGNKFQTKNKGYKRFSLKSQLGQGFDVDVSAALSQAVPELIDKLPDDGHVCDSCFRLLRTTLRQREQLLKTEIEWEMRLRNGPQGKYIIKSRGKMIKLDKDDKSTSKRKLEEVQNIMDNTISENCSERRRKRMKLEPTVAVLCKNGGHKNYMKKAIACLIQYRYHKAFSMIITGSKRAKKAFIGVMEKEIRKEVFSFCKKADEFSQETLAAIKDFSWKKELGRMEVEMPTLYSACHASMPRDKKIKKGQSLSGSEVEAGSKNSGRRKLRVVRPRLGLMMTLPLNMRREKKFGFVMGTLSLLFHRYGSHEKMLRILKYLGVCHRVSKPLIRKVDGMNAAECQKLLSWAVKNLAEVKGTDKATRRAWRKGKAPKAQLPPADADESDEEDDSDDENILFDDDDEEDEDDTDDDDNDDDDDTSLVNMLSSEESDVEDDDAKEMDDAEEEKDEGKKGSAKVEEGQEQQVEVDGWVEHPQQIEENDVEIQTFVNIYRALQECSNVSAPI